MLNPQRVPTTNIPEVILKIVSDMKSSTNVNERSNYYLRLKDISRFINQEIKKTENENKVFQQRPRGQ